MSLRQNLIHFWEVFSVFGLNLQNCFGYFLGSKDPTIFHQYFVEALGGCA